jgi:diaminopimelate decarboxylase
MHSFIYRKNELYCEQTSIHKLAVTHGTPLYVYSQETLSRRFQDLEAALQPLDHRICYAVKANSNLAVLRVLARLGAGFDIVSEGELRRVLAAGGDPARCVLPCAAESIA